MLEVRGLAVEVDGRRVVERADLTVERGRISVLMGPNGSGKTSLLRAIAGIPGYRIAGGRIIMDGEDITELPPWERARRGLAIAHQHPPELEVRLRDLLTELSKRYGSRIGEICPELGIDHLLDRKAFSGFSGGESKRVELLTVMAMAPRYALLDEPDSGVDLESVRILSGCIESLARSGVGVLVITHQGHVLNYLGRLGRGYILHGGVVREEGSALEAFRRVLKMGYRG